MTILPELALEKYKVEQFPRSTRYDPTWVHKNEMGPNALWLTEALCQVMDLNPGMRVLDLGCGRAMSSIFLAKEFDLEVWAADLWIDPTDNLKRIREAGVEDRVFPIHVEAHALPFAEEFFDAVVSLDSYHYYGTDVHYLEFHLLKTLQPGAQIGMISPASPEKIPTLSPTYLGDEWYWMNTVDWWGELWSRIPGLKVEQVELLPQGWELWVQWHEFLNACGSRNRPDEISEYDQLIQDGGRHLGFVRMVARRMAGTKP
jgi:SAM-dependent methyltransferase